MDYYKYFEVVSKSNIKYPYLLFKHPVVESSDKLLIWCHGSYSKTDDPQEQSTYFKSGGVNDWIMKLCIEYKIQLIVPILPRLNHSKYKLDAQMMHRHVMGFDELPEEYSYFERPDLEVIKMIENMVKKYENLDEVIIGGFSAGANFANRFTCFHPDLISACVLMSAGDYMYPFSQIQNTSLIYPFGTSEFKISDEIRNVPHHVYVGELDTDDNKSPFRYDLDGTGLNEKYFAVVGRNAKERAVLYSNAVNDFFTSFEFNSNPNVSHSADFEDFKKAFEFIKNYL